MPQVLKYEQLLQDRPHVKMVLALMYADLLEFHQEVIKCLMGNVISHPFPNSISANFW